MARGATRAVVGAVAADATVAVVMVVVVDTTGVEVVVVAQAATPHLATRRRGRRTTRGATTRRARRAIANRRHATTAWAPGMPPNRRGMVNPAADATPRGLRVRGHRRPSADQRSGEFANWPASADNRRMNRRYVLAGGSGLVGRALASQVSNDPRCTALQVLLRKPLPALEGLPHVRAVPWSSADMPRLEATDFALCALGTTIHAAGSQAAFRAVDFNAVLAFAKAAQRVGARRLALVSALGADVHARVFYNRVKGQTEQALMELGFEALVIARPSLLLGNRAVLQQAPRMGEALAQAMAPALAWLTPSRWRAIRAETVARAMLIALDNAGPGLHILESDQLQRMGGSDVVSA